MTWRTRLDLESRYRTMRTALGEALAALPDESRDDVRTLAGWSPAEVVAHLVLTERAVYRDLLLMMAIERPRLAPIDRLDRRERLAEECAEAGSMAALLTRLDEAGEQTLALIESMTATEEARVGFSPDLGLVVAGSHPAVNVTYHCLGHVEELRAAQRTVRRPG